MMERMYRWLDSRVGIGGMLERLLLDPVPERGGWWYTLGAALFVLTIVQVITGIFLLIYYIPSWEQARDSILYIENEVFLGSLVRAIHYWNMVALVLLIGVHMTRTFVSAAYKVPRELTWALGVILLVLMVAVAFTGGILRWDQAGYFDAVVGTTIAGWTPIIGPWLAELWRGGDTIGPLTITRTFTFHVWILPAPLVLFAAVHIALVVIQGQYGSWVNYEPEAPDAEPFTEDEIASHQKAEQQVLDPHERKVNLPVRTTWFFPYHVFREGVVSLAMFAGIFVAAWFFPVPVDEPVNPATTTYAPSSMWFWLFLDQTLLLVPGYLTPLGAVIAPTIVLLILLFLPWLDRSRGVQPAQRPAMIAFMFVIVASIFVLGMLAASRVYNYDFINNPRG